MIKLEMVSRRHGEAKWTFPETFVKIEPLEPCQDYPFPLWSFMESWRIWRFLTKLVMVSGARRTPRKLHKKFRRNWTTGSMWNGPFYKNMFCGGLFFASRAPLIHFEWIQKLSNPPHFVHGERWCVQKNPTLKHLAKGHFFWDTLYCVKTQKYLKQFPPLRATSKHSLELFIFEPSTS